MSSNWRRFLVLFIACCTVRQLWGKPATQPTGQNSKIRLLDSMSGVTMGEERARSLPYSYGNNLLSMDALEDSLSKVERELRSFDNIGGSNLIRSFDNIGGSNLIKKKSFDNIGGSNLIRSFDNIGGSNLIKKSFDNIGGSNLIRSFDNIGGSALIKKKSFDNIDDAMTRQMSNSDRFVGNVLRRKNSGFPYRTMDSLSGVTFGEDKRLDGLAGLVSDDDKRFDSMRGYTLGKRKRSSNFNDQQLQLQNLLTKRQMINSDENNDNYQSA